jgi:hypothetical protein
VVGLLVVFVCSEGHEARAPQGLTLRGSALDWKTIIASGLCVRAKLN